MRNNVDPQPFLDPWYDSRSRKMPDMDPILNKYFVFSVDMNCVSETNYQRLHAVILLVNEYSVLVPSVNFDQVNHK